MKQAKFKQIRTKRNFKFGPHCCEKLQLKPSLTVPDEALTVREILQRHTRGMSTTSYNTVYDDDVSSAFPDITKLSKIEKAELAKEHSEMIEKKQERLKTIRDSIKAKKKKLASSKAADGGHTASDAAETGSAEGGTADDD